MPKAKMANTAMKPKMIMLILFGGLFVAWRVSSMEFPGSSDEKPKKQIFSSVPSETVQKTKNKTNTFVDKLIGSYRPRLSTYAYSSRTGSHGYVEFYEDGLLVEKFSFDQLRGFGVAFIHKSYGVNLITSLDEYPITSWPINKQEKGSVES